jgi:hypothetical protein
LLGRVVNELTSTIVATTRYAGGSAAGVTSAGISGLVALGSTS